MYLQYLSNQNPPDGFYVLNVGTQAAIRIQINQIQIAGRAARFGELPAVKSGNEPQATYSLDSELRSVLSGLDSAANGHKKLSVTVDYWAPDNIREFRTTCVFEWQGHGLSLLSQTRQLISG